MFELEAYQSTRSAALPWLHHIPEHWRIARAKTVMSAIDVRSATGGEELLTVSSSRGVIPRSSASVSMFMAESYVGHKLCWPGDLVINSLWAWGRGLGVAKHHGIVSTAYGVYRQREQTLDPVYLDHLVRSEPFRWELQVRSQGVWKSRLQMTDARWLDAPLLIPPADEQAAIVKYLAHANARIDKAIAAKRRLIALLDEYLSAALDYLLTIDGDRVEVTSIGQSAELVQTGPFGSQLHADEYVDGGTPVINPSHLTGRGVDPDYAISVTDAKAKDLSRHRFRKGDVVAARRGDLGRCDVIGDREVGWFCGTGCLIVRLRKDKWIPEYFQMLFASPRNKERLQLGSVGSTMSNLNAAQVSRLRLARPDIDVQAELIQEARKLQSDHAAQVATINREIELLREFRSRLVSDVVTGQVDVRELAASLQEPSVGMEAVGLSGEVDELDIDEVAEMSEV